ncbi:MAG: Lrp/AsnC family transcriptional regulator [Candidatus Bathyarchaeia archaeon]|jgi:Lrp/AsnC family transcriptional regulator for asnA, asnC and gidA
MSDIIELDETDVKILTMLINDARTRLKDIAKECKTSSVSVLNRIKRLKKLGVITGSMILPNVTPIGLPIVATIGINVDGNKDNEIIRALEEQNHIVEPSSSTGEYDITGLVFAKSISELDRIAYSIKERFETRKITVNVWSGNPEMVYENVDLQPTGSH